MWEGKTPRLVSEMRPPSLISLGGLTKPSSANVSSRRSDTDEWDTPPSPSCHTPASSLLPLSSRLDGITHPPALFSPTEAHESCHAVGGAERTRAWCCRAQRRPCAAHGASIILHKHSKARDIPEKPRSSRTARLRSFTLLICWK